MEGTDGSTIRQLAVVAVVAVVVGALASLAVMILLDRQASPDIAIVSSELPTLTVHVTGGVATPGVVALPGGARLVDALAAAGGLAADANTAELNLAARLGDGERVVVPQRLPEGQIATPEPGPDALQGGLIDINTASVEVLQTLPGIGPVIGQRIADSRETDGPFTTVDDLARIDGISVTTVEELRPLVTTGD